MIYKPRIRRYTPTLAQVKQSYFAINTSKVFFYQYLNQQINSKTCIYQDRQAPQFQIYLNSHLSKAKYITLYSTKVFFYHFKSIDNHKISHTTHHTSPAITDIPQLA